MLTGQLRKEDGTAEKKGESQKTKGKLNRRGDSCDKEGDIDTYKKRREDSYTHRRRDGCEEEEKTAMKTRGQPQMGKTVTEEITAGIKKGSLVRNRLRIM